MEDMVRRHPLPPYCNDRERELVGLRSALIVKGLLHREASISDADDILLLELPISDQCSLPASDVQAPPTSMDPEDFPLALPATTIGGIPTRHSYRTLAHARHLRKRIV